MTPPEQDAESLTSRRQDVRRRRSTALVVTTVVIGLVAGFLAVREGGRGDQRGPAIRAGAEIQRIGSLARGTIGFALNLRLRDRALSAYLEHSAPGGASAGGLTAASFGARFGLSGAQLASLRIVLRRFGITVIHLYPQRTAMLVSGAVPNIDRLFGLRFGRFATAAGARFFAPEARPRIPAALAPYVSGLGDLSDQPLHAADVPHSGLTPDVTAKAYDIQPLWNAGIRGQGQTIAVATDWGAVNPADLQQFAQQNGLPPFNLQIKQVDGGSAYNAAVGSDPEVDLDLQVIHGVAPEADIIDYQGPGTSNDTPATLARGNSLADIYNQIAQDGKTKIVSTSYGACEPLLNQGAPGDQQLEDSALKALEASNVTVFAATGDNGAYGCLAGVQIQPGNNLNPILTSLGVWAPASSPYAVAVGGTRLEVRSDSSYLDESAWSDPLERAGGGGGVSISEPRPSWQQGPGVIEPGRNTKAMRQTPDVSGPADPDSGFNICGTQPQASSPTCQPGNGGTSAATPFWAASMALVQEYASKHGAGALAQCFAAPVLYELAAKPQPVPAFHQVTVGNNGYYDAGSGWNYATGLGSPDVFNLAQDYSAMMAGRSSRTCPF